MEIMTSPLLGIPMYVWLVVLPILTVVLTCRRLRHTVANLKLQSKQAENELLSVKAEIAKLGAELRNATNLVASFQSAFGTQSIITAAQRKISELQFDGAAELLILLVESSRDLETQLEAIEKLKMCCVPRSTAYLQKLLEEFTKDELIGTSNHYDSGSGGWSEEQFVRHATFPYAPGPLAVQLAYSCEWSSSPMPTGNISPSPPANRVRTLIQSTLASLQ